MDRLHARYPFLSGAREAVREADVDLASLVATDHPAVDRGIERVERAIEDRTVGEPRRSARVELLSYPLARVLVSLVDDTALTRRYARAEARAAAERLREDAAGTELRSADRVRLSLRELLAEFDLAGATRGREGGGFALDVTAYLTLAAGKNDDGWRLVNRELADGRVPVTREELFDLLETAVERRVAAELPFDVPEPIATELDEERARVAERLADFDLTREIDAVVPELFPPCVTALLERLRSGEDLPQHQRFAAIAFLAGVGADADDVVALCGASDRPDEPTLRYQTEHVRADVGPVEYPPPSCATMQSWDACVDAPDRCDTVGHPLVYYEAALVREGDVEDWRERQTPER